MFMQTPVRPLFSRCNRSIEISTRSLADSSHDELWKWKSNYFKNHWNREEFGRVQKQVTPSKSNDSTSKSHDFWLGKMTQKSISSHSDLVRVQARPPTEDNLFNALATASFELNYSDVPKPYHAESSIRNQISTSVYKPIKSSGPIDPESKPINTSVPIDSESPSWRNPEKPLLSLPLPSEVKPALITYKRNQTRSTLPSVSKILKATMPVDRAVALAQWEERMIAQMGQAGFEAYQKAMLDRGHRLHSYIEHFLLEGTTSLSSEDDVSLKHTQSIAPLLSQFSHPHSLESQVVHPTLKYHGYLDCVAVYKGKILALIDWKTSEKKKASLASTFDNPLQIVAYIGALNHDPRYPFQIDHGLIVIVHNDGLEAKVLGISKQKLDIYWKAWLERLKLYEAMTKYGK